MQFVLQGVICYKPVEQDSCFLRRMEPSDYDNARSLLGEAALKVNVQATFGPAAQRERSPPSPRPGHARLN